MDSTLFDPGSTFSYVFVKFFLGWDLYCQYLDTSMYLSMSLRVSLCVCHMYRMFNVMFMDFKTLADLVILDMKEFDIILRMNQFSPYRSILLNMLKLLL